MSTHRAMQHMHAITKKYSLLGEHVDIFRRDRGVDLPMWPNWCFLPIAAWYSISSAQHHVNRLSLAQSSELSALAALGTWRYSQGIYALDDTLRTELLSTVVSGPLPSEVFYRLPEWCIYIETPDFYWFDCKMYGFFVSLEWDVHTQHTELRLLLDLDNQSPIGIPLHIGSWTVTEAVDRYIAVAEKNSAIFTKKMEDVEAIAAAINPILSLLLYICSDTPEIIDKQQPDYAPQRPKPKKTKSGWRLFPADHPRTFTVGEKMGQQLRDAQLSITDNDNARAIKTHLRKAHWHGVWTGQRTGEQRFKYNWISPLIVRGSAK